MVFALVGVRGSIRYVALPGLRRDDAIADPTVLEGVATNMPHAWWLTMAEGPGA